MKKIEIDRSSRGAGRRGASGAPDISPLKKGDLTGCIHTRPLVDFGITWTEYADYIRHQATLPNPDKMGEYKALLIINGVGPTKLAEILNLLQLAYIGSDLHKWTVIPVQGEHGLLDATPQTYAAACEVTALILTLTSLWSVGQCVPTFTPHFSPLADDPDDDLPPEVEIVHRDGEAIDLFRSANSIGATFVRQEKAISKHLANVIAIFESDPIFQNVLRFDELDHKIHVRLPLPWSMPGERFPRDWRSTDSSLACAWLAASQWGLQVATGMVREAVSVVAQRCTVHKVRDKLKVLKWDGVKRVGSHSESAPGWLARYFKAPNEGKEGQYIRLVGRYWLMSAVARAYEPGCKVDTMLILEGSGGERKSSGMALLCSIVPGVVKDTPIDFRSKDKFQQLDGAWVYELAELGGLGVNADELKAYVSSPCDNYRRSFGEQSTDNPRHSVFFRTENPTASSGYLNEKSGNERRNWPVPVGVADMGAIARDREQIWAEAVHLYRAGTADRQVNGDVPIASRYWTAKDDAYLWEHEGRKRAHSGDAMVEMLRTALFSADGYFEKDVKAQARVAAVEMGEGAVLKPADFARPWRALTQDLVINELLPDKTTSRDSRRIVGSLRELGFTIDVNKRVRQLLDKQPKRHSCLVSADSETLRRHLLHTVICAAEAWGTRVGDSEGLAALRDACFEPNLPGSTAELGELEGVLVKMIEHANVDPHTERMLLALELLLGFSLFETE